jgi:hypothetical protein
MNFWRNSRYVDFENQGRADPLRGMPETQFPWLLHKETRIDKAKDTWTFAVYCLEMENEAGNSNMKALLQLVATCHIEDATLEQAGVSAHRMTMLNLEEIRSLTISHETEVKCPLETLDRLAQTALDKFAAKLTPLITLEKKKKLISEKIRKAKFSRFSEEDA